MIARYFNAGAAVGILLVGAGTWMSFGAAVALQVTGALVWVTTLAATRFAISMKGSA